MIKVIRGVTWQKPPSVEKSGNKWFVFGTQRLEVPNTGGWRHFEQVVYLQTDGSWSKAVSSFNSKEEADAALKKATGEESESPPISALATALQKAQKR